MNFGEHSPVHNSCDASASRVSLTACQLFIRVCACVWTVCYTEHRGFLIDGITSTCWGFPRRISSFTLVKLLAPPSPSPCPRTRQPWTPAFLSSLLIPQTSEQGISEHPGRMCEVCLLRLARSTPKTELFSGTFSAQRKAFSHPGRGMFPPGLLAPASYEPVASAQFLVPHSAGLRGCPQYRQAGRAQSRAAGRSAGQKKGPCFGALGSCSARLRLGRKGGPSRAGAWVSDAGELARVVLAQPALQRRSPGPPRAAWLRMCSCPLFFLCLLWPRCGEHQAVSPPGCSPARPSLRVPPTSCLHTDLPLWQPVPQLASVSSPAWSRPAPWPPRSAPGLLSPQHPHESRPGALHPRESPSQVTLSH